MIEIQHQKQHHRSSLCNYSVPWLGEGLSMLLPYLPILRYPLPDATLPVVVYFFYPPSRRPSSVYFHFVYGFQVVIGIVHRLSHILLTCPAQVHFRLLTYSITSVTFVFSLTQMFVFQSRYVMFNILLSILVCAAASLFFASVVSAHVSAPYVIARSTHEL